MASTNAVWGIDIGQCALKAIKLRPAEGGRVEAVAFDVIEHAKILSQPDADRDELIADALKKFTSRNDWQGDKFVVGVPGQQTFARFCKMPPIDLKKDAKKIPELVRYEASQQIPFDMDDVVWDYQVFTSEETPDIEVGIFAIRKDLIRKHLGFFSDVGIAPLGVQTVPAALYNFCHFDGRTAGGGGATVIIDVGAQNTDLIIVEPNSAWTRNIPLGGNSFTETLVRAFKLSFAKAESLKRTAATSKYARQIFQAMRPIFAELVAEIQRSVGFYGSTHRDVELRKVLALGNAFRLPGLLKYLENNLTISGGVARLEKFNKLVPTAAISAPQFTENVLSFAAAYGLALQGLGFGKIRATLLPPELARVAIWKKKRPYFIATAAALVIGAGVPLAANTLDKQALNNPRATDARNATASIIREGRDLQARYNEAHADTGQAETDIQALRGLQKDKLILPRLLTLVYEAMPETNPPGLTKVRNVEQLKELIKAAARPDRGQLLIESFDVSYEANIDAVGVAEETPSPTFASGGEDVGGGDFGGRSGRSGRVAGGGRMGGRTPGGAPPVEVLPTDGGSGATSGSGGFLVRVQGRLLYGRQPSEASQWLQASYLAQLRESSRRAGLGFYVPDDIEAEGASHKNVRVEAIRGYYEQGGDTGATPGQRGLRGGGGPPTGRVPDESEKDRSTGVRYPDPVTGEETATDWRVEFVFKVKLGAPPPREEPKTDGDSTQAPE